MKKYIIFLLIIFSYSQSLADCGKWRWSTKTASDKLINLVNLKDTVFCSIYQLQTISNQIKIMSGYPVKEFRFPDERRLYQISGVVQKTTIEADGDFKIVLKDSTSNKVIYLEIPHPDCIFTSDTVFQNMLRQVRHKAETSKFVAGQTKIKAIGVGFIDFQHGKNKEQRIFFELHPLIDFDIL